MQHPADIEEVGKGIATAFVTIWGRRANIFFLPAGEDPGAGQQYVRKK
jgi:hypothetical protein